MIVKDPTLRKMITAISGEDILPISIKVRYYGKEDTVKVYNNMLLEDLLTKIVDLTGKDLK